MKTLKSFIAAVLMVVMIVCLSVSAFAAYEEISYDDVSEMYGTTLSGVNTLYIKFADKLGIIPSLTDGSFNPSGSISRIEALKIAYRMLHYQYDELANYSNVNTDFDESGEEGDISDVYMLKSYIAWAMDYQLINSQYVPDKKFEPAADITGEEFITLIAKVLGVADEDKTVEDYETDLEVILSDSELTASSTSVSREQAAVIVSRAMMYDPSYGSIEEDMFVTISNYDLDCLATEVYGVYNTSLTVRATKQRPLNYEDVNSDVLFSNGVQVDVGADMSAYIGYQMDIVFIDKDASGTFTQDEEIITYQMVSPWVYTASLSDLTISSYAEITGTYSSEVFSLLTTSMLYLNDDLWPDSEIYNLTKLVDYIEFAPSGESRPATSIMNRPNLEFTFIKMSANANSDVILATEWIPGKIATVTDNYISVFSYYDNEIYLFEDNNVVMTKLANPKAGDYVNFYTVGDKLYLTSGTTAELVDYSITTGDDGEVLVGENEAGESTNYQQHLFYNKGSNPVTMLDGTVVAVLDTTGTTYLALEEARASEDVAIEILDATVNADSEDYADIRYKVLATGETGTMTVEIANISSATGVMDIGDYYTYYTTQDGDVIMSKVDPITTTVIETEDYFITEGGQKYLKTDDFVSDSEEFYSGTATILVDCYNGVWAVEAA